MSQKTKSIVRVIFLILLVRYVIWNIFKLSSEKDGNGTDGMKIESWGKFKKSFASLSPPPTV